MEIIAKTDNGYLVGADTNEVKEILGAISGKPIERIEIGQKLPAIDYAGTIRKVKRLKYAVEFEAMFSRLESFCQMANELKQAVYDAENIEV